jgi:cobalt-zinc-cadmium efflux system outer membrane protein
MRHTFLCFCALGFLVCLTTVSGGQTAPFPDPVMPPAVPIAQKITLSQAIAMALKQNPQRLASIHQVASARSNLSSQRAFLNPDIQFSGLNNTVSSLNFRNPSNYVFSGVIETSGRQAIRTHESRAQYEGAVADSNTTRLSVQQGVTAAYVALQSANLLLDSELQAYADSKRIADLTDKQFQLGAAPETNAIQARIALEQEVNNLRGVTATVEQARATLNQQMGGEPTNPVDAADPFDFKPLTLSLPDLDARALPNRPEIRSSEAAERALREVVKQQRSLSYPDLFYQTTARFDGVFAGVNFPLFDLGSIRNGIRKAKEDVLVQEAQTLQVRQQVKLDVTTAWLALDQTQAQALRSKNEILPRAQTLFAKIEQGYRLGGNTILDLLNAQATVRSTRNDYNAAIGAYRQAIAQLERAVGVSVVR